MKPEEEKFKEYLLKEVRRHFDNYWYIEQWIEEMWEGFLKQEVERL